MAVAGDTGYLANTIAIIEADAILQMEKVGVIKPLVSVKSSPKGDTISWIVYNDSTHIMNAADVAATAEGTVTPTTKLQSAKRTATMDMYSIGTDLYDEAKLSNADDPASSIGRLLGNACAAKVDSLLAANFDNFSNSVGTSSVGLTVDNLFAALAIIESYDNMGEINGVFDRRQIWGALGLMNDLVTSNQFGGSPSVQQEGLANGFVSRVAGIGLYNSNQLAAAVSSAQKGGIFTREAIGWGYVGPELKVELKREADFIRDRYNASFFAGTCEIKDSCGVEVHTKTVA